MTQNLTKFFPTKICDSLTGDSRNNSVQFKKDTIPANDTAICMRLDIFSFIDIL